MGDTVKIRITSPMNISFDHVINTGIDAEDWDDMSTEEQDEEAATAILTWAIEWNVVDR